MNARPIVYLDNNATTMVAPEVFAAMAPYFTERYGNASSMHDFGGALKGPLDRAREQVAALLGAAHASEIIFTSGGTESDNAAWTSAVQLYPERRHLITSRVEHPAVLAMAKTFETRGYRVTYLGVDRQGRLNLDDLRSALGDDTALVSLMWANNETGTLFDVEAAARLCRARGVLFHTDAVQAVGKVPLVLKDSVIDLLSLSGHKLHGPKGIGALYVRRGTRFKPLLIGGHQERGRRAGTENVPGIVGLGAAAELALHGGAAEHRRVAALRDQLENTIERSIPDTTVNGDRERRLPNTCNISFGFVEGEAILLLLSEAGIAASSGSACSSGSLEPSHVLRAMGVPFTHAHGSIRFSLSRYTTEAEVAHALAVVPQVIARLREISPYSAQHAPAA